jgi:ketosteroid isomerase-like protein
MVSSSSDTNSEAAATRVLAEYYRAFSTLEVQAVLPYFHEPSLFIGPQGVFAASTSALVETVFTPAMEGLRARGFARSELSVQNVKSLSATTTLVIGVALRYKHDGQELERVGVTYVLYKSDAGWKIAVLIIQHTNDLTRQG